jgi:glycosyltransferase involved in cell wall biosynthesis
MIILIPIYREKPDLLERFSLDYSIKAIKKYPICFIGPKCLDPKYYLDRYENSMFLAFENIYFSNIKNYNRLLMSRNFYQQFNNYDFLMILQTDAIILRDEIDFWCNQPFDYVGAPWPDHYELQIYINAGRFSNEYAKHLKLKVGNGGLSIRRISKCIALLDEFSEVSDIFSQNGYNEDLFFSAMAMLSNNFVMPNEITASRFSVELEPFYYYRVNGKNIPMGGHAWWKYEPAFWLQYIHNVPAEIRAKIINSNKVLSNKTGGKLAFSVSGDKRDLQTDPLQRLRTLRQKGFSTLESNSEMELARKQIDYKSAYSKTNNGSVIVKDQNALNSLRALRKQIRGHERTNLSLKSYQPTECNELKVIHLSAFDLENEGIAAYRLHMELIRTGINSFMPILKKNIHGASIAWDSCMEKHDAQHKSFSLWPHFLNNWKNNLLQFPQRSRSMGIFSKPESLIPIEQQLESFDIVHLHWVSGLLDIPTMQKRFAGHSVVWTLYDMNPFTGGCHYSQDCTRYETSCHDCPQLGLGLDSEDMALKFWRIKQENYRAINMNIVTQSRRLGQLSRNSALLECYPHYVIPCGIDLKDYYPVDSIESRQQLGISENAKIILFETPLFDEYRKGCDLLYDVIRNLSYISKNSDAKIILAVFGPSNLIINESACQIQYLGDLKSISERRLAYSAADAFLLPSREEYTPSNVIESLACGTPVAAFDIGDLSEIILHQETGYLASFPDVEDLAKGIHWLIYNKNENIRNKCRNQIFNQHDISIQAKNYLKLYHHIISSP